jgi:hypothetical protein
MSDCQSPTPLNTSLLERVRARVLSANHAIQRRDSAPPRRSQPARIRRPAPATGPASVPPSHELRALLIVYHTMARQHRRYRERTGNHIPTALQSAARAFKREPSVFSLVPVAGFLDDLRLLKW